MSGSMLRRVVWLQALVIVVLGASLAWFARDELPGFDAGGKDKESSEIAVPSRVVPDKGGAAVVRVAETAQRASGIAVAAARGYLLPARSEAYGSVVDLRPLLDLRARRLAAAAELAAARAAQDRADAEQRRVAALYADDRNASQRALEAANADQQSAHAKTTAAAAALSGIDAQLRQSWGPSLAAGATADNSVDLDQLASGQASLVQIVLPGPAPAPATASLRLLGTSTTAAASLISAAPQADPAIAGSAWFYRASAALPAGARLGAELPGSGKPRHGALVPAAALVWHAGSPWIYLQRDDDHFERRPAGAEAVGNDWFVAALPAGAKVVVAGAQLLLSEELRYQIKNENED